MRRKTEAIALAVSAVLAAWPVLAANEQRVTQKWELESTPDSEVIALWQFSAGQPGQNSRADGAAAALAPRGRFSAEGKFGGGLQCLGVSEPEAPTGALVANHPELSPQGAFSVDLWARADAHGAPGTRAFLIDNKGYYYVSDRPRANNGFMLFLLRPKNHPDDVVTLNVGLGFGEASIFAASVPIAMPVGTWRHLAFTYDGAGTVKLYADSEKIAERHFPGVGAIAPSTRDLAIGERGGSLFQGFTGLLDDVCIRRGARPYHSGKIDCGVTSKRRVFLRHEKIGALRMTFTNSTGSDLQQPRLILASRGQSTTVPLPETWPLDGEIPVSFQLDTTLRAGDYPVRYHLTATMNGRPAEFRGDVPVTLVNRTPPAMPVVMRSGLNDPERMADIGFTHANFSLGGDANAWQAGEPVDYSGTEHGQKSIERLEHWMRLGFKACHYAGAGKYLRRTKELKYKRVDRDGNLVPNHEHNPNVAHPDIQKLGYDSGASTALSFGDFPVFEAALIHSEVRDSTALSFQDYDVASAEQFLGGKIPPQAVKKNGVHYSTLADFPADRVLPDDYPLLRYYTWFWKDGDGWNPLNSQIHAGLQSTGRKIWTFFDPAVRVPSLWGSGGRLDFISQWTYTYPDPLKIGQATDELFAMADGCPGQQVMKMTQVIWKRTQTAPALPKNPEDWTAWEREFPEVKYYTIAPDCLSEALWSKLSRPVKGIMYHGWGSLVTIPGGEYGSYLMTNSETAPRLKQLLADVVKPLGPTLLEVPDIAADIAILQSFSSQIFAGRGTYGWSGAWEADVHLILQWAGYQPRIIFDETIRRDGLDAYKILVLPGCDVLTESVVEAIRAFQRRGGIVIADENVCPAILADVFLPVVKRASNASEAKARLQQESLRLRQELAGVYQARAGSSDLDVVTRLRRYETTDYLFAINDRREFGDYVGHHRLVMEKGLPHQATLWLDRPGYVYDLVRHQAVPSRSADGGLSFEAEFGPGEGRLFMVSRTALDKLRLRLPATARRGRGLPVAIAITDRWGRKPAAAVPVEVRITDADGAPAEFSGYYTARHGQLDLTLQPAANDTPGVWTVTAKNLATGLQSTVSCQLQ